MIAELTKGQKYRTNEVKLEILYFLANGKFTGADIRGRLAEVFRINEPRGIRKHLSELYKWKFVDREDKLGNTTIWWLKDDFDTFRKIILFIKENGEKLDYDVSDFTHNTKYSKSHLNEDLIKWIISSGIVTKWYKTFGDRPPKKRDFDNTYNLIFGISKKQLLSAIRISPQILLFLLEPKKLRFIKNNAYNEFRHQIFGLLLKDAIIDRSDKIYTILYDIDMKSVSYRNYPNGLKLSCTYEFFPEDPSKIRVKR